MSNLASFYVEGPYTTAPVGRLNLSNPAILSSNRTLADFVYRSNYRIQVRCSCCRLGKPALQCKQPAH